MSTKIWQDSWISLSSNLKPYGPLTEDMTDLRVSDLLTSDLKWNSRIIEELLPDLSAKIQCMRPSQQGVEDAFIGQPLKSGIYSVKSGYQSAMTVSHPPHSSSSLDWYKDVWSTHTSEKLKVFPSQFFKERIPLGENLQRRGFNSDLACPRCKETESVMHIFFRCLFVKRVWDILPLKNTVHLAVQQNFAAALEASRNTICLPPSGVSVNILPWICWQLWITRNHIIFKDRTFTSEEVALHSITTVREWITEQGASILKQSSQSPKQIV